MRGEKILILNHTRLGDLVQTTPLIRALKAADPTCHITLLVNVKFAGILAFAEGVDATIILDALQFANNGDDEPDFLAAYDTFKKLLDRLEAERFDRVVNLSHSKLSAIFALASKAPTVAGFDSTDRGERILRGAWLTYFSTLLTFRRESRLNLVDLYIKAGGGEPSPVARLSLTPTPDGEEKMRARMATLGVDETTPLIGVQAGASREDRRWPPSSFAAVADRLATERGGRIVLFGAPSEKALGDQVADAMTTPPLNLIGETGLPELVSWIRRLSVLVTNDTGTMHIAAALGVPVVALFFVHARGEETGPYTEKAIILQADIECAPCGHQTICDHHSCLRSTTPDDVIDAVGHLLDGRPLPPRSATSFANTIALAPTFATDDQMIDLWPLHPIPLSFTEWLSRLFRPLLVAGLEGWDEPSSIKVDEERFVTLARRLHETYDPNSFPLLVEPIDRFVNDAETLGQLADEGNRLILSALQPGTDLKQLGQRLSAFDARIALFSESRRWLLPLVGLYQRRVEALEGESATALAPQAATACRWLSAMARRAATAGMMVKKELMLSATMSDRKTSTVESTRK